MDEFAQSIMIALLPTTRDWTTIDLPHLTLVYAGEIPQVSFGLNRQLTEVTKTIQSRFYPQILRVESVQVFGSDTKVDVLRLRASDDLLSMELLLEQYNKSKHKEYQPHVTVGPKGSSKTVTIPETITFDRVAFYWGNEKLILDL